MTDKPQEHLAALVEAMTTDFEAISDGRAGIESTQASVELVELMASFKPEATPSVDPGERIALLAALFDRRLDMEGQRKLTALIAASSPELQNALASLAYLDGVAGAQVPAPADLVEATIVRMRSIQPDVEPEINIVQFRGLSSGSRPPMAGSITDRFELLAAASKGDNQAIISRSQSGLWTLEIFVDESEPNQEPEQGYLMLTVHSDHRATYEGRVARVFVLIGNEERVLTEQPVRHGEVYSAISLAGLKLPTRDAVNVVFGPAPVATGRT